MIDGGFTREDLASEDYLGRRVGLTSSGKEKSMEGIQYVVDDRGKRIAVMIDLQRHGALWEDFCDNLTARSRAEEPRETLDFVKETLRKQGKLDG